MAGAANGRVYMREEIDESFRGIIARHEATHVMRQFKFKPYLDFLERTPEMLNISEPETRAFIEEMASDYNIDPFNIDNGSLQIIYDEINAYLYGEYAIDNDNEYLNYVDKIVYDYNEYIDELSQIHERFKAERKGVDEATVQEQSRDYLEADTNQTNQNYGGDNYANLDNGGNGRRNTAEYAQRQVGGSSKDVSMADRNGGQGRRFTLGSGEALLSTDSEGVSVRITDASKLSNTSIKDEQGRLIALYHATDVDFDGQTVKCLPMHWKPLLQTILRLSIPMTIDYFFIKNIICKSSVRSCFISIMPQNRFWQYVRKILVDKIQKF